MKFALIDGQRREAQPGLSAVCASCGSPMVAKCGDTRTWHWGHKGRRVCDPWWENETEWHRAWKGQFPSEWQEVVHRAIDGEKHVADVKTKGGWVIEFQHSFIDPQERQARDAFYGKLIWVVDAARRKRDSVQFRRSLESSSGVGAGAVVRRVFIDDCTMLKEWAGRLVPVFFDFGPGPAIWWLFARDPTGWGYVAPFSRAQFIEIHLGEATELSSDFDKFVSDVNQLILDYESQREANLRAQEMQRVNSQSPGGLERFMQFRRRSRRRL